MLYIAVTEDKVTANTSNEVTLKSGALATWCRGTWTASARSQLVLEAVQLCCTAGLSYGNQPSDFQVCCINVQADTPIQSDAAPGELFGCNEIGDSAQCLLYGVSIRWDELFVDDPV